MQPINGLAQGARRLGASPLNGADGADHFRRFLPKGAEIGLPQGVWAWTIRLRKGLTGSTISAGAGGQTSACATPKGFIDDSTKADLVCARAGQNASRGPSGLEAGQARQARWTVERQAWWPAGLGVQLLSE